MGDENLVADRSLRGIENSSFRQSKNYGRTRSSYLPDQGLVRYSAAMRHLIPVRRTVKYKEKLTVDEAGFFSYICFSWLSAYMYKAHRKGLVEQDIPQGSEWDSCEYNAQRLEKIWQQELVNHGPTEASLIHAIWKFSRTRILANMCVYMLSMVMGFLTPVLFMRNLLEFAEQPDLGWKSGIFWACALTLSEILRTVLYSWSLALSYRTGIRLRSACLTLLYRKVIRTNSLPEKCLGSITNLFSNDSQRVFDVVVFGPQIVGGPFVMICGIIYTWWLLDFWALIGIMVFMIYYPIQFVVSRLCGRIRERTVKISDQRISLIREILNYVKLIKMYAWENIFIRQLSGIRTQEHKELQSMAYLTSLSISTAPTIPIISAIVTFLVHISTGHSLTAAQAFSILTFLTKQMKSALTMFTDSYAPIVEGAIAYGRLKRFLLLEEFNVNVVRPIDSSQSVCIGNGTFSVNGTPTQEKTPKTEEIRIDISKEQTEEPEKEFLNPNVIPTKIDVLSNIHFSAGKGKLVGVCGPVGSGKSSLLLAIMGQLRMTSGQLARDGSFAYVSQESWILNCTLKENILFGEKFDAKRYYQAVYSCSLTEDIRNLPGDDDTEIGERGINLSGGQKQRVALARALYSNKDIYLLDDPLSAVDANVAAHIFKECILNALKNKTVIFVTHQLQFLKQCSEIYMLKEGRVVENGTHDELMSKRGDYFVMVNTTAKSSDRTKKKDDVGNIQSDPPSESVSAVPSKECIIEKKENSHVTSPEKPIHGNLNVDTYLSYVSAAGGYFVAFFVILTFFFNVGSTAFSSWWLAVWINAGSGNTTYKMGNETFISQDLGDNPNYPTFQMVYALTIVLILVSNLLRGFIFTKATLNASRNLHNKLFQRIMHSNMSFFESNPIGRILNIFSKDIDEVDSRLPNTLENMLQCVWIVAFAIFFICLVFPWFCLVVVVIAFAFFSISHIFRKAVRDLKRIENATRAPVLSWVNASVHGLNTIHAFGKESDFISKFCTLYDDNSTAMYMGVVAMRWLAVRIDSLAVIVMAIISFMIVGLHGSVTPAMAGLALTYSAHISGVFQYTIRLLSETEMRFISVEQINRYCESMEPEDVKEEYQKPPSSWPDEGRIRFSNVSLRYRPNLPDVLRNINFSIIAGEKIGIVGRSGSGKSSLVCALFRLVELCSGYIKIDGIDIGKIPLETLRSKLTIIPQDPVLFSGTVRFNLDPKGKHTDEKIKAALIKTKLAGRVEALPQGLNTELASGDNSLSVGERQLLCLTRALLRPTKILVLDEATASVDRKTEEAVQNTIQKEFSGCTVLTIAHRLNTVMNCDKVLVLGEGKVLEFESPDALMTNSQSEFSKLRACETETTPATI